MKRVFIVTLIFFLVLPFVSAYALRTGVQRIYFEPGLKTTISVVVENNDLMTKPFRLVPATDSKALIDILDEVVYLREEEAIIEKGEQHEFLVDLTLPDSLPYGTHEITIRIYGDDPNREKEGMIIIQGIVSQLIKIYSLYPGKYLVGTLLKPESANIGQNIIFETIVRSIGAEDVENARAKIDIYHDDNLVGSVYSDSYYVASKETEKLVASLLVTDSYEIGQYVAKVSVEYDGEIDDLDTKTFNIGELSMGILNITSREFENNKINKFDIHVESKWNEPADVYAELIISDFFGTTIDRFKTQTVNVEGWRQGMVPAYLHIKDIENDNYILKVILHYEGKTSERSFAVRVSDTGESEIVEEMPGMPKQTVIIILLSAVIGLLIIIVVMLFLHGRGKKGYSEEVRFNKRERYNRKAEDNKMVKDDET